MDIAARVISPWLTERLGQPFVVENRPGESGNLATREVVRAEPDGHTLLMATTGLLSIAPHLYPQMPFDPARDFAPERTQQANVYEAVAKHIAKLRKDGRRIVLASYTRGARERLSGLLGPGLGLGGGRHE